MVPMKVPNDSNQLKFYIIAYAIYHAAGAENAVRDVAEIEPLESGIAKYMYIKGQRLEDDLGTDQVR